MTTIDNNNYELWLLRYAEGELSASERKAVEAWLVDHPEATEELALYGEAPRLERDENVRYTRLSPLAPQDHLSPFTFHLSPFLRWSAAAAVVLALMVPALRMGTMGHLEPQEPLMVAAAQNTPNIPSSQNTPIIQKTLKKTIDTIETIKTIETISPEEPLLLAQEEDTLPLLPQEEPSTAPTVIPSESLIVYLPAPDTLYSDNLLIYDDSRPRLRDLASEWIEDTPISKFFRHNLSTRKTVLTMASNQ